MTDEEPLSHADTIAEVTDGLSFGPWIDGGPAETAETFETIDPATHEPIAAVGRGDASHVDRAVSAAWDAYDREWAKTTYADRARRLVEWIKTLRDHAEELTRLECLDTGKPIADTRAEVEGAIDTLEYYASIARGERGAQIPATENTHIYTRREPYGVVGQIVPWNFPIWSAAWKLGPALAAGNAAVLKPATDAPLSIIRMVQLSADILPAGVCNVVPGSGSTVGSTLSDHTDIRKVSFTGSAEVGEQVMRAAAPQIVPVTLELGGKSPFVVFPDADLETAVDAASSGIFYGTGQICDALSRAIVHENIADEFLTRLCEAAAGYAPGDPLEESTTLGPLTTRSGYDDVREYMQLGREEGATVATGGGTPEDPKLRDGWYVEPTVFTEVDSAMTIAREEIFGPVLTVQTFETYEEAIEMANDTDYGLAAGIATERTSIAHRAAADLQAGIVYVNAYGPILPEAPYGGFKQSGIGRELGTEVLDHYQQTKTVCVTLSEPTIDG